MDYSLFDELDFAEDSFDLTRYILTSEIRLDLLLNLYESSKHLDEIRLDLNKKPGNLLRGLNELIERKLVVKYDKSYSLSSTGHLLAMNIVNLFDNWSSVENHFDFWQRHSINSFTGKFIRKIHLWESAELIESNNIEFDKTFRVYFDSLCKSTQINMVLPIFSRMYMSRILETAAKNDASLTVITNAPILDLIRENDSEGLFASLVKKGRIDIIIADCDLEIFFTACDNFASLFLFFNRNLFDDSEMLLVRDEDGVKNALVMFSDFKSRFNQK